MTKYRIRGIGIGYVEVRRNNIREAFVDAVRRYWRLGAEIYDEGKLVFSVPSQKESVSGKNIEKLFTDLARK